MLDVTVLTYGRSEFNLTPDGYLRSYRSQQEIITLHEDGLSVEEITTHVEGGENYVKFVVSNYTQSAGFAFHLTG